MISKTLARTTRVTRATYSVVGAPPMNFGLFLWTKAYPFEIELTWTDGVLSWDIVVRAWVMKRDGTPRKAVTRKVDALMGRGQDRWLFAQVSGTTEPGFEPPAILDDVPAAEVEPAAEFEQEEVQQA